MNKFYLTNSYIPLLNGAVVGQEYSYFKLYYLQTSLNLLPAPASQDEDPYEQKSLNLLGPPQDDSSPMPSEATQPEEFVPNTDAEADTNIDSGMNLGIPIIGSAGGGATDGPAPAPGGGGGYGGGY